ncbi:MAG: enoyl-CoA hydratase-related protein, partial [Rhodanobacteraceae bacterium]
MAQTQWTTRGDVAVITLDHPPVNGLSHALRSEIAAGVQRAVADKAVRAIVLVGAGRAFSGGADIREFNTPEATAEPGLRELVQLVESAAKPVVAAIHGFAMGGGLELAMACHYRVAQSDARIAMPEVKLGLLPGAGGTQRLPRLVPLDRATQMITTGVAVPASQLADTRLFAKVVDGDVVAAAVETAQDALARGLGRPRARDLQVSAPDASRFLRDALARVRATQPHYPAPAACIEALTAAVEQPFDEGLKREGELFAQLVASPESHALRHAFFGERAAGHIADVPADTPVRRIATAAVIGAGTMGGGIAMNFANAGIPVTLIEVKQEALDHGLTTIRRNYERTAAKGRITTEAVEKRMALIRPTLDFNDATDADIVIE